MSQVMIQRSRELRLNNGTQADGDNMSTASDKGKNHKKLNIVSNFDKGVSLTKSQSQVHTCDQIMHDEIITTLKQQLENEQKKQAEMKREYDEKIETMNNQALQAPKENIAFQASKAVDEIMSKGGLVQKKHIDELSKLQQELRDSKESEKDLQNQNTQLEKQLLHAQIRVKEAEAKEQVRVLRQETEERRTRMLIDKLQGQIRDLKNQEERLKSDHAQKMTELMDQVDAERLNQVEDCEKRFMVQINEIKQAHAREREVLIQQKFTATQELQIMKMDHSELIRNTNFEDQRDYVESISSLQAEIGSLKVALAAQHSNYDIQETVLQDRNNALQKQIALSEANRANEKSASEEAYSLLQAKNSELEEQLVKVNEEKDKLYKEQMEKIQENLDSLKEQIASTNQSLIDQSMVIAQQNDNSLIGTTNIFGRLHQSDIQMSHQVSKTGEQLRMNSPCVPRLFANLNTHERRNSRQMSISLTRGFQDPVLAQQHSQFDSQDKLLKQSGADEGQLNMGNGNIAEPASGITVGQNNLHGISCVGQHSFLFDPAFNSNDYLQEAIMIARLQALTINFTCKSCWQVLSFSRFFDDDHECLKKVDLSSIAAQNIEQNPVKLSQIGCCEITEELKEPAPRQQILGYEISTINDNAAPESVPINLSQRSGSFYQSQRTKPNQNLRSTAQAALSGHPVVVTEINLPQSSLSRPFNGGGSHDTNLQKMTAMSFMQNNTAAQTLETSIEGIPQSPEQQIIPQVSNFHSNCVNTSQQKAFESNQQKAYDSIQQKNYESRQQKAYEKQIETYVHKIQQQRKKIEELDAQMEKFKQENESLIDDLCETKTKVAVLEEKKALLHMEVTEMRNSVTVKESMNTSISPATPTKMRKKSITLNSSDFGLFSHPNFTEGSLNARTLIKKNSEQRQSRMRVSPRIKILPTMFNNSHQNDPINNSEHINTLEDNNRSIETLAQNESNFFRSPQQQKLIPLSQKFSAYPTTEFRSKGKSEFSLPTIQHGKTRNGASQISIQNSQMHLASNSFKNLSQIQNSSLQNLRLGQKSARGMASQEESKLRQRMVSEFRAGSQRLALLPSPKFHQKCDEEPRDLLFEQEQKISNRKFSRTGNVSRRCQQYQEHQLLEEEEEDDKMMESNEQIVMETEGDEQLLLNPLVTPGLMTASNARCSMFETNNKFKSNRPRRTEVIKQLPQIEAKGGQSQSPSASPRLQLSQSHQTITLNSPYDRARMKRREDSPDLLPTDISPSSKKDGVTRRTIYPGAKPKLRPKKSHQPIVQIKQAVPILQLALVTANKARMTPQPMHGSNLSPNNIGSGYPGTFGTFGAGVESARNATQDQPLLKEDPNLSDNNKNSRKKQLGE